MTFVVSDQNIRRDCRSLWGEEGDAPSWWVTKKEQESPGRKRTGTYLQTSLSIGGYVYVWRKRCPSVSLLELKPQSYYTVDSTKRFPKVMFFRGFTINAWNRTIVGGGGGGFVDPNFNGRLTKGPQKTHWEGRGHCNVYTCVHTYVCVRGIWVFINNLRTHSVTSGTPFTCHTMDGSSLLLGQPLTHLDTFLLNVSFSIYNGRGSLLPVELEIISTVETGWPKSVVEALYEYRFRRLTTPFLASPIRYT